MVAKLLAISIKSNGIQGFNILDLNILISQFADDTTLFLKHEREIPLVIDFL